MRIALPCSLFAHLLLFLIVFAAMSNRRFFLPDSRNIYEVELVYMPPAPTTPIPPAKTESVVVSPPKVSVAVKTKTVAPKPEKPVPVTERIETVPIPEPEVASIPETAVTTESSVAGTAEISTSQVKVDNRDFTFTYYLNIIHQRVRAYWKPSYQSLADGSKIDATIGFTILRDGSVVAVKLEKSSDRFLFDQAAQRAIFALGQLPPLPAQFNHDQLSVHIEFEASR